MYFLKLTLSYLRRINRYIVGCKYLSKNVALKVDSELIDT